MKILTSSESDSRSSFGINCMSSPSSSPDPNNLSVSDSALNCCLSNYMNLNKINNQLNIKVSPSDSINLSVYGSSMTKQN